MNTRLFGYLYIILICLASSCVPKENYKKVLAQNDSLRIALDECQYGEEKIIAEVEKAYSEKNYFRARQYIDLLYDRHPESTKNKEYKELLKKIDKEELAERQRQEAKALAERQKKEAEEKERIRLANLNNTGMWTVQYYVDDFGEPTKKKYIRNISLIRGTFSNTATQDSELDVKILINSSSDIDIMLYEYADNNPVKAYDYVWYKVLVQDKYGKRLTLGATNSSDRLSLGNSSYQLHNALMKGGTIMFRIYETESPTTQYNFTIQNADWYENAYRKLKEK